MRVTDNGGTRALSRLAVGLTLFAAGVAVWFGVTYRSQPVLELFGFRQAQTAITAYWMQRGSPFLAYETPVAGAPWAIPFEFPVYQWVVSWLSGLGLPLDASGRLVSLAAFLLCLVPIRAAARRLALDDSAFWVFGALFLSCPVYLFYGRTFMIETLALLFTLSSLPFAIDVVRREGGWRSAALAGLFLALALLQKVTTAAGLVPLLVAGWAWASWRRHREGWLSLRRIAPAVLAFLLPAAIGILWAQYASHARSLNPFGTQLTNSALFHWNFGYLPQRYSWNLWHEVVWKRTIGLSGGGPLGVVALTGALVAFRRVRPTVLLLLTLLLLPLLTFTSLHVVHDYYQVASTIYWVAALAVCVAEWGRLRRWGWPLAASLTLLLMAHNYAEFAGSYWPRARLRLGGLKHATLGLAETLARYTEEDSAFLAYGFDWSSELGYYAKRRSFTVPAWFEGYGETWRDPERFLGGHRLGALVVCPNPKGFPGTEEVAARLANESDWWLLEAFGCQILLRPRQE